MITPEMLAEAQHVLAVEITPWASEWRMRRRRDHTSFTLKMKFD